MDGSALRPGQRGPAKREAPQIQQAQQAQLSQQVGLQKENWDNRQEELQYKEAQWEAKMQTILSRGNDQWAAAENVFLTRWNAEKSAEEAEIQAAQELWGQRIADHHADQAVWQGSKNIETPKLLPFRIIFLGRVCFFPQEAGLRIHLQLSYPGCYLLERMEPLYCPVPKWVTSFETRLRGVPWLKLRLMSTLLVW